MTTEGRIPLPERVARALQTDNLDELEELISTWPASELELLHDELKTAFQTASERMRAAYQEVHAGQPEHPECLQDYHTVRAWANLNYAAINGVIAKALLNLRVREYAACEGGPNAAA